MCCWFSMSWYVPSCTVGILWLHESTDRQMDSALAMLIGIMPHGIRMHILPIEYHVTGKLFNSCSSMTFFSETQYDTKEVAQLPLSKFFLWIISMFSIVVHSSAILYRSRWMASACTIYSLHIPESDYPIRNLYRSTILYGVDRRFGLRYSTKW